MRDQLGRINQTDCVVEFSFCLSVSTMLIEWDWSYSCGYCYDFWSVIGGFARIIRKKEEYKEKKALVGEELGHKTPFINPQKTVNFREPKHFWEVYVVCTRSTSFRLPYLHQLCRATRSNAFYSLISSPSTVKFFKLNTLHYVFQSLFPLRLSFIYT